MIDLDGDSENIDILVSRPLTLNVDAIDDDGTNTFNGRMTVDSYLTVNVPGGWEIDGEFIGDHRHLTGSPVTFDEAVVRFNAGGFGFRLLEMDAVFTENARVFLEGGVNFLRSNVVIEGGQWTAVGDRRALGSVEFSGNVTIAGPTTMRLRSVDLGSVGVGQGQLTIDQPLLIETDEVESFGFPVCIAFWRRPHITTRETGRRELKALLRRRDSEQPY